LGLFADYGSQFLGIFEIFEFSFGLAKFNDLFFEKSMKNDGKSH
jgi:hypothetical protein